MTITTISTYVSGFTFAPTPGNSLVVSPTGTIGGNGISASLLAGDVTIRNNGTILPIIFDHGAGIVLSDGGLIVNGSASRQNALIAEYHNNVIKFLGKAGTVENFGTVDGEIGCVDMGDGGTIVNGSASDTTALMRAGSDTIFVNAGDNAIIRNFGTITTSASGIAGLSAIDTHCYTTIDNGAASSTRALIFGGIHVYSGAVIDNFGTITGEVTLERGQIVNGSATDRTAVMGNVLFNGHAAITCTNFGTIGGITGGGGPGTVSNYGTIGASGVLLRSGRVTNGSHQDDQAVIMSGVGLDGPGTIENYGTIIATESGAALESQGVVKNLGTIVGSDQAGINCGDGGRIYNGTWRDTTAIVEGGNGIFNLTGALTVENYGTIKGDLGLYDHSSTGSTIVNDGVIWGTDGTAVRLGNGNDIVVLAGKGVFRGIVNAGAGNNTLVLAGGGAGAVSNLDSEFVDFQTIGVDVGANWTLNGDTVIASNVLLADSGQLFVTAGLTNNGRIGIAGRFVVDASGSLTNQYNSYVELANNGSIGGAGALRNYGVMAGIGGEAVIWAAVVNDDVIGAAKGTLQLSGSITGTGGLVVEAGAVLVVGCAVSNSQTIAFDKGGTVMLTDPTVLGASIEDFGPGATIDLRTVAFTSSSTVSYSDDTLRITNGRQSLQLQLLGQFSNAGFREANDGHGGTALSYVQGPVTQTQLAGNLSALPGL